MKDKLLALAALRTGDLQVEGETVHVRELSTPEYAEYGRLTNDQKDERGNLISKADRLKGIAFLISTAVIDEAGVRVFSDDEAITLAKSPRVALPIVSKVMELSGTKEGEEKHPVAS